jgi:hypothetical protein
LGFVFQHGIKLGLGLATAARGFSQPCSRRPPCPAAGAPLRRRPAPQPPASPPPPSLPRHPAATGLHPASPSPSNARAASRPGIPCLPRRRAPCSPRRAAVRASSRQGRAPAGPDAPPAAASGSRPAWAARQEAAQLGPRAAPRSGRTVGPATAAPGSRPRPTSPIPRARPPQARAPARLRAFSLCSHRTAHLRRLLQPPVPRAACLLPRQRRWIRPGSLLPLLRRPASSRPPPLAPVGRWSPAALLSATSTPRCGLLFTYRQTLSAPTPSQATRLDPSGSVRPSGRPSSLLAPLRFS